MKAINANQINFAIKKQQILNDVSISIEKGKIVGLLGPSGAGKTTLIKMLLGLKKPNSGNADILGQPVGSKELHSQVGYVTQSPAIYPDLTVYQNLKYFADLHDVKKEDIQEVLKDVDMANKSNQLAGSLSGGEQARLSLASALLGKPPVLLLDEPTVGLDPVLRAKLWKQFNKLSDEGTTILITSHVMDEADRCDEIVFIRNGEILISGPKDEVLKETKAPSMEEAFLVLAGEEV